MSSTNRPGAFTLASPIAAPTGVAVSETELSWRRERERISREADERDRARAASPRITLVAITGFTIVDDLHPDGRIVEAGDEFEISEVDLPLYSARGMPKAMFPTRE
ncbi:hypothetical protein [Pseudoroseomonas sp. WGS1072]|uniref:hypothetical protein n=1 Tax=Roseomonas sp. WGS1072 TaxID=3366816 RepID=UPI003BEFE7DA